MSFPCILQLNNSEDNRVTKDLDTMVILNGVLKEETSIISPTITFDYPVTSFAVANYMTIPAFNRSYFITDIRSITATLTEISLKVDVLSTYDESIRACTAIIAQQENRWNLYLDDGTFKTYSNPNVLTKPFPNGFGNDFYFILAVAGES